MVAGEPWPCRTVAEPVRWAASFFFLEISTRLLDLIEASAFRLIRHTEWNMHGRHDRAGRFQVARLVVEEDVRLQHRQHSTFLDATEEKSVIGHDAPTLQRI